MEQQLSDMFADFDFGVQSPQEKLNPDALNAIKLTSVVRQDSYTDYIKEHFDLAVTDKQDVYIPNKLDLSKLKPWNIGVICGASGSGKSTILRHLAMSLGREISNPMFDNESALISNFSTLTPEQATMLLSSIGLASVPTWIRPFRVLSNGEQYRASLAKAICDAQENEIIFVDEYTSVVDRDVAKSMSNALQKYIRRTNKKIILATCHYDILEWLQPNWIYDLNKGGALEDRGDCLRQRPTIHLQVYRTTYDTWERFKRHHYMTAELNTAAACYVFTWNDKPVAFVGVLPMPNGQFKDAFRCSRIVVTPDFQGIGLGSSINSFMGGVYASKKFTYYIKTVNPGLGEFMKKSPLWAASASNMTTDTEEHIKRWSHTGGLTRPSYCYKYVGDAIQGFDDLIAPIDEIRKRNANIGQLSLDF